MSLVIILPDSLLEEWSEKLEVSKAKLVNVVKESTNKSYSFKVEEVEETTVPQKPTPKKAVPKKVQANGVHTCERVPRNKQEACGKNARKSITTNGVEHWYCGSEKSGCYKSAIGAVKKATTTPTKKTTASSSVKTKTLLDTFVEKKDFSVSKVTVDGIIRNINSDNRVLLTDDAKAYAMLDDSNKIIPLTPKEKRWAMTNGIQVDETIVKNIKPTIVENKKKTQEVEDEEDVEIEINDEEEDEEATQEVEQEIDLGEDEEEEEED